MPHLGSIRHEHGAAWVISLLPFIVLFVAGSGTWTTRRTVLWGFTAADDPDLGSTFSRFSYG
jgi:hypothetical protein